MVKTRRFLFPIIAIFLLASVCVGIVTLHNQARDAQNQIALTLHEKLHTINHTYHYWYEVQKRKITLDVSDERVIQWAQQLLEVPHDQTALLTNPAQSSLRAFMENRLAEDQELGIFVIAPDRISLASMRNTNVGIRNLIANQRPDLLDRVFAGETLLIPPIVSDVPLPSTGQTTQKQATMFIAAPIKNAQGKIIAAFTRRLNVLGDFQHIVDIGRFGDTGEAILFNTQGLLVSKIRFENQLRSLGLIGADQDPIFNIQLTDPNYDLRTATPNPKPSSEASISTVKQVAFGPSNIDTSELHDYRRIETVSAIMWNKSLNIGLIVKMDKEEAYKTYSHTRNLILSGLSTTTVLTLLLIGGIERIHRRSHAQILIREKQLRESDIRFRATFEQVAVGIAHIALNGKLLLVNQHLSDMLGYSHEELLKTTFQDMTHPHDVDSDRDLMQHLLAGDIETYSIEKQYSKKDRTHIWILLTVALVRNANHDPDYLIFVIQDISHRKQAQQALIDLNVELEKRIEERTAELSKTVAHLEDEIEERERIEVALKESKMAAEAANQTKSEFLANMSHEIRTPMNAIMGFSEVLNRLIVDPNQREYLSSIQTSSKSLLTLINDILDLSKVEAGKIELEYTPTDPRSILGEIEQIFAKKINEKELHFDLRIDTELPEKLLLDDIRLRQILLNIVGNAVKFTEKGHIQLRIQSQPIDAKTLTLIIEVEDTGIGIPEDLYATIFDPFEQQRIKSHIHGGTGLGLAITQRLVGMMGGVISVTSQVGKGSTFRVQLNHVTIATSKDASEIQEQIATLFTASFQTRDRDDDLSC